MTGREELTGPPWSVVLVAALGIIVTGVGATAILIVRAELARRLALSTSGDLIALAVFGSAGATLTTYAITGAALHHRLKRALASTPTDGGQR